MAEMKSLAATVRSGTGKGAAAAYAVKAKFQV